MDFVTGRKTAGKLIPVNTRVQAYSEAGKLYELHMESSAPIQDKAKLATALLRGLSENGLKVTYLDVGDTDATTQVTGLAIEWAAVIAAVPGMFFLAGVALAAIAVFLVWTAVPSWAVGLGLVGAVLLAFGWYASKHKWWREK